MTVAIADSSTTYERLGVLPWSPDPQPSPVVDHDPRSGYVETFWLPVLGPSTTLLLRRLAERFDRAPDGFEVEAATLGRELGLGTRVTPRSGIVRTIQRCTTFGLGLIEGDLFYVRRRLPSLVTRQVKSLSPPLRQLHGAWADAAAPSPHSNVERASSVAASLLELGDSPVDVEMQLQRWNFAPPVAWHAVQRATRAHP